MKKQTKKDSKKAKREVNKEVREMLERHNFRQQDLPEDRFKDFPQHIATFLVKVKSDGSEQDHILICSVFDDAYRFAVMDDSGIIKLLSFKAETPVAILSRYIEKAATFFAL